MPMRLNIIILISLGILLSLGAAFGTFRYTRALEGELASARASLRAYGETVKVPVPKSDAARGATLNATDFTTILLPATLVPGNVLRELPATAKGETLVALADLAAGELLRAGDLALPGANPSFGLIVAPGARAFAVAPRNLRDFAGLIAEGSAVDLIWTHSLGGGQTESRLIGAGLRVLALPPAETAATGAAAPSPLAGKLVLEGAEEAALLYLQAEQTGYFHILLSDGTRPENAAEVAVGPADLKDLPLVVRRDTSAPLVPVDDTGGIVARITGISDQRQTCTTSVVRGGTRTLVEVPC